MINWLDANRAVWDERVPLHVSSDFYDVDGFRAGRPVIQGFEVDELGALGDQRLAHLQCHFGLDTLDLARQHPTLEVVGLDFSAPAVVAAESLAAEIGVAARTRFVRADVYDALPALGSGGFDVVYTGKGSLNWLPDLPRWASIVHDLLRPGGRLYLIEHHPVGAVLGEGVPEPELDYFSTEAVVTARPPTYATPQPRVGTGVGNGLSYEWIHSLSQVLDALIRAGLVIRFLHEWPFTNWQLNRALVPYGSGYWTWPGPGTLPLMYSIRAERPTA
jgi:SAM-dependent methyltransferase